MKDFNHSRAFDAHARTQEKVQKTKSRSLEKDEKRRNREAHNLATYAVRKANNGQIGTDFEAKTTPRFVPFVSRRVDELLHQKTNEILAAQGLKIEVHTDPTDSEWDLVQVHIVDSTPVETPVTSNRH